MTEATTANASGAPVRGAPWPGFTRGMGIGGWLTNYKRFNVLPPEKRLLITAGDLEHFESYITEADVANIASMGADHIRLGFDQIVVEESLGKWRECVFAKIADFAGWCEKYGLRLVLNLHKAVGNYCDIQEEVQLLDDAALQDRFVALWLEFERRFADRPDIAFELLNEVRNVDPAKWNRLADRTIRALRALNPGRWLVVGSTCWNAPSTLSALQVWDDPRVVYTFHMYAPFEFTHQRGVLQPGPLAYNRAMTYPSDDVERYRDYRRFWGAADPCPGVKAIDREFLRSQMQGAHDFLAAHPGKILWNGEFGTIRHADRASRFAYMRDVIAICREWGIPYCVWNYLSTPNDGNRFSLVDDDSRALLFPVFSDPCEDPFATIAASFPVEGRDIFQGGHRTIFRFEGFEAWVVSPDCDREDRPWSWCMEWPTAFQNRVAVPDLIRGGYHHVTLRAPVPGGMSDAFAAACDRFQRFLVDRLGLAPKARLIGMSWGGFCSVRYASLYPENVAAIYLDAPLLDFSTLDYWKDDTAHQEYFGKGPDYIGADDPFQPVNRAPALARAGIPVLLAYGGLDSRVPPATNCELFARRFREAGGHIEVVARSLYGHHPHGFDLNETSRITSFFK